MKKVKSLNGYSIFEASPRDVDKYGYKAGGFYVFFSSDIRDFGIANSSPEYDGLDTLEAAEACCLGNYAKAREIVEGRTTAAGFEEIAEVERQLNNGEIDDDGEPVEISDEPELKQSIGRKIRELRKARHMTQSELAARPELPISQASLAAYETGAREPGMEMIAAFARFFHVSIDYLFGMTPDQEQVGDSAIRLSENARAFLRCSDVALLETVSSVLSASAATEFFEDLRAYIMACSPEPEDLAELLPMADHLNRSASADCVALEMLTSYKRKLLDRALDELCEELAAAAALSTSTKPAKGGERHGNSSKTGR